MLGAFLWGPWVSPRDPRGQIHWPKRAGFILGGVSQPSMATLPVTRKRTGCFLEPLFSLTASICSCLGFHSIPVYDGLRDWNWPSFQGGGGQHVCIILPLLRAPSRCVCVGGGRPVPRTGCAPGL